MSHMSLAAVVRSKGKLGLAKVNQSSDSEMFGSSRSIYCLWYSWYPASILTGNTCFCPSSSLRKIFLRQVRQQTSLVPLNFSLISGLNLQLRRMPCIPGRKLIRSLREHDCKATEKYFAHQVFMLQENSRPKDCEISNESTGSVHT